MSCKDNQNGINCEVIQPKNTNCTNWQLTKTDAEEVCFFNSQIEEHLNIGGADAHVFKLLGVHEQGELVDLIGYGNPISSGDANVNFNARNAFNVYVSEWKSSHTGQFVVSNAFIGYDFGEIKLDNGVNKYGIDTSVRHNISTIRIKQGNNSNNRVTKVRIERSDNGTKWYGVAVKELPDNAEVNEINFRTTVSSRYWRIRPLTFNGRASDNWTVQAIEMFDYDLTSIDDIQDFVFQENRDRDYASESVLLKTHYDLLDTQSELTALGIELPSQMFYMQFSLSACVRVLGRPLVIGDIIELPSEAQFDFNMNKVKKYLEVNDVSWSVDGYTPGYTPLMLRVMAQPMMATQETMDIFSSLAQEEDDTGLSKYDLLSDGVSGNHEVFQDFSDDTDAIRNEALNLNPELGADTSGIHQFSQEQIDNAREQGLKDLGSLNVNQKGLYIEDAMPPNGADYTEGNTLPDISISKDGDYHRLTYTTSGKNIPTRLFRYSVAKNRWVFLESDKRGEHNPIHPKMMEYYQPYNNPVSNKDI